MGSKKTTIGKPFQNLTVCLRRESLIRDDDIFLLQNSKVSSNTQNFIIKDSILKMCSLIKIIENQLMITLALVRSVIKSLIINYPIK